MPLAAGEGGYNFSPSPEFSPPKGEEILKEWEKSYIV